MSTTPTISAWSPATALITSAADNISSPASEAKKNARSRAVFLVEMEGFEQRSLPEGWLEYSLSC